MLSLMTVEAHAHTDSLRRQAAAPCDLMACPTCLRPTAPIRRSLAHQDADRSNKLGALQLHTLASKWRQGRIAATGDAPRRAGFSSAMANYASASTLPARRLAVCAQLMRTARHARACAARLLQFASSNY